MERNLQPIKVEAVPPKAAVKEPHKAAAASQKPR